MVIATDRTRKIASGTKRSQPVNCVPANIHVTCVVSGAFRQGKMHLKSKWNAANPKTRANKKLKPLRKALIIKMLDVLLLPNDLPQPQPPLEEGTDSGRGLRISPGQGSGKRQRLLAAGSGFGSWG